MDCPGRAGRLLASWNLVGAAIGKNSGPDCHGASFLEEYISHLAAVQQTGESQLATKDLLDLENVDAWLTAAHRGATRRRPGLDGPQTSASTNSMAARVSTLNSFSRYCGSPLKLQPPAPEFADRLTPTEAHRTLRLLSGHQPAGMMEATWERSVALVALAICSGHGIAALHPMHLHDLELDRPLPRARVREEWHPLDPVSRSVIARWTATHRALTAGYLKVLQGGNVEELWAPRRSGCAVAGARESPARQFVRRVVADQLGISEQYDWRDHPFTENRHQTYDTLTAVFQATAAA